MKIAFALYPQMLATGVSVPIEMLQAAHQAKGRLKQSGFEALFVAEKTGPVEVAAGLQIGAQHSFSEDLDVDWIFCPPMWGPPWQTITSQTQCQHWIVSHYQRGIRIVATGTGVGMVAETGLLNGKVATTHWYYLEKFKRHFEAVDFQAQHFITHQDGIYCAGSINAQTDLVLHFIEREFGEDSLALVERQFMHEIKRTVATPYYEPGGLVHHDEVVSLVQSWIRNHYADPISMSRLEQISGLSERQLRRRFSVATGDSPNHFLQKVRVEEAQGLLRESNLSVTDIALATGFASSAYFSKVFHKLTAMTPVAYRKIVRSKAFSIDD